MFQMLPLSRYFLLLAIAWMGIMTWLIYPQFRDTVRVDGRLTTVAAYIRESCGERVGPSAALCTEAARAAAQRLLLREQGKSIFLIDAPIFLYLAYLAFHLVARLHRRRAALA